jgi:hypothetical protein
MTLESEETPWLTGAQVRSAVEADGPLASDADRVKGGDLSNCQLLNGSAP